MQKESIFLSCKIMEEKKFIFGSNFEDLSQACHQPSQPCIECESVLWHIYCLFFLSQLLAPFLSTRVKLFLLTKKAIWRQLMLTKNIQKYLAKVWNILLKSMATLQRPTALWARTTKSVKKPQNQMCVSRRFLCNKK